MDSHGGRDKTLPLFVPTISLGCLEGIEFLRFPISVGSLDVSRECTGTRDPFEGGFTIGLAVKAGGIFLHPVTTNTLVYDGVTRASVVRTSLLGHKHTISPHFYGLTNHGYLLPSCPIVSAKK
jgi:hypothetical protein